MRTAAEFLSGHIERTVRGPMWHGPALGDVLKDVSYSQARSRPVAGAHTIWEIVLHVTAWAEIARARLRGERLEDPTPHEDWPPPGATVADWTSAVKRLDESHQALAADVRQLDEQVLAQRIHGLDYTVSTLLHGVIEHSTYHGGQIAILKRGLSAPRTS